MFTSLNYYGNGKIHISSVDQNNGFSLMWNIHFFNLMNNIFVRI